ncbi:MAG: endolytic transglycosylase MltG, partial [Candidatus Eremiobacteraeota bacterium]|nr:endolytic transglycosylase MltG [Candidatus Eremiobacteraeota bacterium]
VSSAFAFDLLARFEGRRSSMKAGEVRFGAHRPMTAILQQVVAGGRQVAIWVTIPEGITAKEIAATLASASLGRAASLDEAFFSKSLRFGRARTPNLEGYLFPETYLIPRTAKPDEIAKLMTDEFERELPPHAETLARRLGLSVPQVVTLASLVEREAKADDERALMAGVYYNRLRLGMPLQVDATIEYTFAHHKDAIALADLASDSPYNTYRHTGLPPTPIASPGRASLLAAFYPRPSAYLYYVSMGNGHSAFARTLAEHNSNVARYLK